MASVSQWGNLTDSDIKNILLVEDYITQQDLDKVGVGVNKSDKVLTDVLIQQKVLTRELVGQAIAEYYGVPFADLWLHAPAKELVLKLPEDFARKHHVVVSDAQNSTFSVATSDPSDKAVIDELGNLLHTESVAVSYAPIDAIEAAFISYRKSLATRFSQIIEEEGRIAPGIIDEIFDDAIAFRASDIHLEPREKEVVVRFRIDGVLHEAGRIPNQHFEGIVNRIKVLSHIRTDKHFDAQDGTIRWEKNETTIDMRVSLVPLLDGEKIVIRLLSSYVKGLTLGDIGLSPEDQDIVAQAAAKPFGMIIVAGPTGAGKTTTMYSLLEILNRPEVNITTIEDPVEYKVVGINQIQVNPDTNLTFAQGLRSIVRQDPNIILVGEIRDKETAEIAVNAALTGHLLFSSFHANDAATTIPRLLTMGIEPFLLASTLELIVSQRLVRRICESCRYSVSTSLKDIAQLMPDAKKYFSVTTTLYKGKGCSVCGNTGYVGRIALFEIIQITKDIENAILDQRSTDEIWDVAKRQGSKSLFEDGIEKVKSGITTLEELLRVAVAPTTQPASHEKTAKSK